MTQPYDLTQLDSHSFEHLVNFLALKVLGNGVTGFATGADGGRDGYLKGRAPYPTETDSWDGVWFLQSKFHKPHLSKDPQKWLISEVKKEIALFETGKRTTIPNIWIIASNIEPTGVPTTGSFDKIKKIVHALDPNIRVDIWGGRKILDFLLHYPEAATAYGHFLTPGHIITNLYQDLKKHDQKVKDIIEHFIISQFNELSYTKLEQAGSGSDQRPKIYELFRDLPVISHNKNMHFIMSSLVSASNNVQKNSTWNKFGHGWKEWSRNPIRARILLLKGGPGQGKSTAGQYFGQLQRAAYILSDKGPNVPPQLNEIATELKKQASAEGYWPTSPRIPLFIELKDFANWYSSKTENEPRNIVAYLCNKIRMKTSKSITAEIMHEAFKLSTWFANFDGLDEVPNDLKDQVAEEIITFANELIPQLDADFLILCTTRPQGYSGQFENLYSATVTLCPLPPNIALECASAVVKFNRSEDEALEAIKILEYAIESEQVRELMTTPLQAHIMAVVVRDGGKPPEKRWELFNNFYTVMKKRESQKNFPDIRISALLRDRDQLLKSIHDRLGICLHTKSENSKGAEATFEKNEFYNLAKQTTAMQIDGDIDDVVDTLMEATTERLVFVNTPESSESVRFDIRQLQEFFAAEFIYSAVSSDELRNRLDVICGDPHWREVVHFLLSALANNKILSELSVAVSIIQQLDDDAENHKIKMFKRRMGVGSLLTLRLIEEGVLEQDKRIRYQFNSTLIPLWNNINREVLNRITRIKKDQSRHWLINNMIDSFIGLDYSENLATGYLLSIMLPSNHSRMEEVNKRFLGAPDYYFSATLELHQTDNFDNESEYNCQSWFYELISSIVIVPSEFKIKTLTEMIKFLVNKLHIIENRNNLIISKELIEIIEILYNKEDDKKRHEKMEQAKNNKTYCFVSPVTHDTTWKSDNNAKFSSTCFSDTSNSAPINLIKLIIKYNQNNSIENYKLILNQLKINGFDESVLPSHLKAMVPLNFDDNNFKAHINFLEALDDVSLKEVITNGKLGDMEIKIPINFMRFNDSPFEKHGWSLLCSDFPEIALSLCDGPFYGFEHIQEAKVTHEHDFYFPLVGIAQNYTNLFAAHPFLWHEVFSVFPQYESEIRKKLISTPVKPFFNRFSKFDNETKLIKIDIESEKNLLINFAIAYIQNQLNIKFGNDTYHIPEHESTSEVLLSRIGISPSLLISYITNDKESEDLRIAALSFYLTNNYENKSTIISQFFDNKYDVTMINLLNSGKQELLIRSLYIFLHDAVTYDTRLMEFLGHVSLLTKENYDSRMLLQSIYQRWRERSFAPVQEKNALESWLSYSY